MTTFLHCATHRGGIQGDPLPHSMDVQVTIEKGNVRLTLSHGYPRARRARSIARTLPTAAGRFFQHSQAPGDANPFRHVYPRTGTKRTHLRLVIGNIP